MTCTFVFLEFNLIFSLLFTQSRLYEAGAHARNSWLPFHRDKLLSRVDHCFCVAACFYRVFFPTAKSELIAVRFKRKEKRHSHDREHVQLRYTQ